MAVKRFYSRKYVGKALGQPRSRSRDDRGALTHAQSTDIRSGKAAVRRQLSREHQKPLKMQRTKRPLKCRACGLAFAYSKAKGEPPVFEFSADTRAPASQCQIEQFTSACRFHVARRWKDASQDIKGIWAAASKIYWVTIFIPGHEFTLAQADQLNPAAEAKALKRLLDKAFREMPRAKREPIQIIGAVEPGIMETQKTRIRKRRLVAMHAHLLIWGIKLRLLKKLLKAVVKSTDQVVRPLKIRRATTPAAAVAYSWKQENDHRVTVRNNGRNRLKRRPRDEEAEFIERWSQFNARDAEILYRLRRSPRGRITAYGRG